MFTPLSPQQWNYETAAHLLNRAGFGGTPAEIASSQDFILSISLSLNAVIRAVRGRVAGRATAFPFPGKAT